MAGKGRTDVLNCDAENIVALCDVDSAHLGRAAATYPHARPFADWRVMFDQLGRGIDAVTISTPDHAHFLPAYRALKQRKHVFCQKPLTHTLWEARATMNCVAPVIWLRLGCVAGFLLLGNARAAPTGRWSLKVDGPEIHHPAWLEIAESAAGGHTVRYVGRIGSVRDIKPYELGDDALEFSRNEWFGAYEVLHHASRFDGDRVAGTFRRPNGQILSVAGERAPPLDRADPKSWTARRPLFNGRGFEGWVTTKGDDVVRNWRIQDGEVITFAGGGGRLCDLRDRRVRIRLCQR